MFTDGIFPRAVCVYFVKLLRMSSSFHFQHTEFRRYAGRSCVGRKSSRAKDIPGRLSGNCPSENCPDTNLQTLGKQVTKKRKNA